jgi:hypothetical protein
VSDDFNYADLAVEAEQRLDDQGVPEHWGVELLLSEGEQFAGRFRASEIDHNFKPPRPVFLLLEPTGAPCFIRSRTVLEREMAEVEPGDHLVILRGQDTETRQGNTLQMYGVAHRPGSEPLPNGGAPATDDDIPF